MTELDTLIMLDQATKKNRAQAIGNLKKVQFTPLEGQIAFIKELVKSSAEAEKFFKDPKGYAVAHGVLLDPAIVEKVTRQVLFDVALDEEFAKAAGPYVTKDLVDIRKRYQWPEISAGGGKLDPGGPRAWPAAVAAVAAVVVAAAEVVTMVVTLVRASRPGDLVALQGLDAKGTVLPGGAKFADRTGILGHAQLPGVQGSFLR